MVELADIVRCAGPAYQERFGKRLLPSHQRAMDDIVQCRTPALGASLYQCDDCGYLQCAYHSCCNRHCPKCHHLHSARWLEKIEHRLLPCPYYLLTFTLPQELRSLARSHQRTVYAILLREAAASVIVMAQDRQWMGGQPGILAVLHTWTRDMAYHVHAHLLVTAGGLSDDGSAWIHPANPRFLFPGYALSKIFRAKVRDALRETELAEQADPQAWTKPWTVQVQHAGSGTRVAAYLARYMHRVAITNPRIESFVNGRVCFRYTHSRTKETRRQTLPVEAFLARFLQHVLPRGFHKIRYYGILSPPRKKRLEEARHLLALDAQRRADHRKLENRRRQTKSTETSPEPEANPDSTTRSCPTCQQGRMRWLSIIPRAPP